MKIWVERIPEEGSQFEGEELPVELGLEPESFFRLGSPLHYALNAQRVSDELVVCGAISADLDLQCSRCAEFFSTTVTDSDFVRAYPVSGEVDFIDITDDFREALLLQVPAYPVCSGECKGLCAQCGANLNESSCRCVKGERPNQWSILDNLNL